MKETVFRLPALLVILFICTFAFAQEEAAITPEVYESDVHFTAIMPTAKHLTAEQKTALQKKVEKIIARVGAGIVTETNAFGIDADIAIKESKTSAGLLRDVSLVIADVTLTARNIDDGSVYYSNTIEVQADAIGKEKEAINTLINNIKVTDPAFVRFIRTARKRIVEFYNARGLALPIRKEKQQEVVHDTIQVENTVIVEVPTQDVPDAEQPEAKPANGTVKISTAKIDFKIISCEGDISRNRITIVAQLVNHNEYTRCRVSFDQAFDADGNQLYSTRCNERFDWDWFDFPREVPMKREFYIKDVAKAIPSLSFLKIGIGEGSTVVEVRNLNVNWK